MKLAFSALILAAFAAVWLSSAPAAGLDHPFSHLSVEEAQAARGADDGTPIPDAKCVEVLKQYFCNDAEPAVFKCSQVGADCRTCKDGSESIETTIWVCRVNLPETDGFECLPCAGEDVDCGTIRTGVCEEHTITVGGSPRTVTLCDPDINTTTPCTDPGVERCM